LLEFIRPLVDTEAEAVRRDVLEPVVVPGLLQAKAYAYAIHAPVRDRFTDEGIEN